MKTITFFSEKGGVGKTTFSILMASWLHFKKREPVFVMDFDYPSFHLASQRHLESVLSSQPEQKLLRRELLIRGMQPYHLSKCFLPSNGSTYSQKELEVFSKDIAAQKNKLDHGYYIFDFPGHFFPTDPMRTLVKDGMLDTLIYVHDSDMQSRKSVITVDSDVMRLNPDQKRLALWNRENSAERNGKTDWYSDFDDILRDRNIDVVPTKMRDIVTARRNADTQGFIRSTLCWPETNIQKACPYIDEIFEYIKQKIDDR